MIEMTLLTILTLTVLALLRPGKTPVLDSPLLINRPGHYQITLAPQLNLAQPFIEAIAQRLGRADNENSATLCFDVRDKNLIAPGRERYLLAITQRNGLLYFQAIFSPLLEESERAEAAQDFAQQTLVNLPAKGNENKILNKNIALATKEAAEKLGISVNTLLATPLTAETRQ